jgi:hypothetical protein
VLERGDERVLRQLLGEADVAHHACDAGDHLRRLDPPDRIERAVGRLDGSPSGCGCSLGPLSVEAALRAQQGADLRTSTVHHSAAGHSAASASASSSVATSDEEEAADHLLRLGERAVEDPRLARRAPAAARALSSEASDSTPRSTPRCFSVSAKPSMRS